MRRNVFLQVGAALRPAFASDMPSDVTAMACEVSKIILWSWPLSSNFLYCSLQRTKHCYGGSNRMSVNRKQSICRSKSTNQHTPSKYIQPVPVKSAKNSLEQVTIRLSFMIGWNVGVRLFSANHKLYQWMKSQASLSTFTLITPYSTRLLRWKPFKFWACYQCYKHVLLVNVISDMSFHN